MHMNGGASSSCFYILTQSSIKWNPNEKLNIDQVFYIAVTWWDVLLTSSRHCGEVVDVLVQIHPA